jgi:N,N'-diacetyllegionaminate synthase
MFGPDVSSSVTTSELRKLVEGVRHIERMLTHPVEKDVLAAETLFLRELFSKSIVTCVDLPAGTILEREHVKVKKPGVGIPFEKLPELLGRRLARRVKADHLLREEDFERGVR